MHVQKSPKTLHFLIFDFESNFLVKFCRERRLIGTYCLNVATSIFLPRSVAGNLCSSFPNKPFVSFGCLLFFSCWFSKDSQKKHSTRAMIVLIYQFLGISLNCNFFFPLLTIKFPLMVLNFLIIVGILVKESP
jgi:hypothetical protein